MNSLDKNIQFPQYRRYKNGLSYFKILSFTEFEEVQVIGNKRVLNKVTASQYPEKVFINDLLFGYEGFAEQINEEQYNSGKGH